MGLWVKGSSCSLALFEDVVPDGGVAGFVWLTIPQYLHLLKGTVGTLWHCQGQQAFH